MCIRDRLVIVPLFGGALALLLYLTIKPLLGRKTAVTTLTPHGQFAPLQVHSVPRFRRIAIVLDFSGMDSKAVSRAIHEGGKDARYHLIHIVESAGAYISGSESHDREASSDKSNLITYVEHLTSLGYKVDYSLAYGNPKKQIPLIVHAFDADLLIMAAHGHQWFHDLIFGTTVGAVRHKIRIPLLVVR